MLLFWVVLFVASLGVPWLITTRFAQFRRKTTKPEFRTELNNKMMELLGILVALIWVAVLAGILAERYLIAK